MSLANLIKSGSLRGFATATVAAQKVYSKDSVVSVATVAVAANESHAVRDLSNLFKRGGLKKIAALLPDAGTHKTSSAEPVVGVATVATVAVAANKTRGECNSSALHRGGSVQAIATATPATHGNQSVGHRQTNVECKIAPRNFKSADKSIVVPIIASDAPIGADDPDSYCWPHSVAMNSAEIKVFSLRLSRFASRGAISEIAEKLADALVLRDRESDERRLCLECRHLSGYGAGSWRCGNWQVADMALNGCDAKLPADLLIQLQRCQGFLQAGR